MFCPQYTNNIFHSLYYRVQLHLKWYYDYRLIVLEMMNVMAFVANKYRG